MEDDDTASIVDSDVVEVPKERRRPILSAITGSRFYLVCAIVLAFMTVGAVTIILVVEKIMSPAEKVDVTPVYIIIGITGPAMGGLLGAAGIGIMSAIDGLQSHLIRVVGEKEHAKGKIEGLRENPNINIS